MQKEVRMATRSQAEIDAERAAAARNEPSISYAALTAALERKISSCRDFAAANGEMASRLNQYLMASGAFDLWDEVTTGCQIEGDQKRLRALAEAIRSA